MILTKELADALCTVIAVGFIDANTSTSEARKLVEPNFPSETIMTTEFICEGKDKADYGKVASKLREYGVEMRFKVEKEDIPGKAVQPFVYSKTRTVYDPNVLDGIASDFFIPINRVENRLNSTATIKLQGAYIGGLADLNKVEFCGASDLHCYNSAFRRDIGDEVGKSYEHAKEVSVALNEYLNEAVTWVNGPDYQGRKPRKIEYKPTKNPAEFDSYDASVPQLFASCHGMVKSIYNYLDFAAREGICVELALGSDTCKVASCLPCSLFMTANGVPASATHLGRGDNWHYPKKQEGHRFTQAWRYSVCAAYGLGIGKLAGSGQGPIDRLMANVDPLKLPEIFLEALTYEGSFTTKIKATLGIE